MSTLSGTTLALPKLRPGLVPLALSFWAASAPEVREAKSRVLVIDDEVAICELLSLYLRKEGLEVGTVQTAVEGRTLVERGQFDLVILDWKLNGTEGLDLLHLSKTLHPEIPVIVFTGAELDEGLLECGLAGGADAVVRKRGPLDTLSKAVFRHLGQRQCQPID